MFKTFSSLVQNYRCFRIKHWLNFWVMRKSITYVLQVLYSFVYICVVKILTVAWRKFDHFSGKNQCNHACKMTTSFCFLWTGEDWCTMVQNLIWICIREFMIFSQNSSLGRYFRYCRVAKSRPVYLCKNQLSPKRPQ